MGSQDPNGAVSRLVIILRKLTRMVQVAPFVYLLFLSVYLLTEQFLPEWALSMADNLFNMPVYVCFGMLIAGRVLRLCKWFKCACLLPLLLKVENYVDAFIYTMYQEDVVLVNTTIGIIFLVFLINANAQLAYGRTKS